MEISMNAWELIQSRRSTRKCDSNAVEGVLQNEIICDTPFFYCPYPMYFSKISSGTWLPDSSPILTKPYFR